MKLKKIIMCLGLCIFTFLSLAQPIQAKEGTHGNLHWELPDDQATNPKWTMQFTQPINTGSYQTWYIRLYWKGHKVYCIQPLQEVDFTGNPVYSETSLSALVGNAQRRQEALWVSSLGYGYKGDTSQEMDWATQLLIWDTLNPGIVNWNSVHSSIRAKVNQIRERVAIMKKAPSFDNQVIPIYGYGKEYAVTIEDTNGVFSNYLDTTQTGIHTQKDGNKLTLWLEEGDAEQGTLSYPCLYASNQESNLVFYSSTSQNMATMKGGQPKTTQVGYQLVRGSLSLKKLDVQTGEQAQGLAQLDQAIYDVYRNETKVGSITWKDGQSSTLENLDIFESDGITPVTYTLKEVQAPTGYHTGIFVDGVLTNQIEVQMDSEHPDIVLEASDEVTKVRFEKVDGVGKPLPGATLTLMDNETGEKIQIAENQTQWISEENALEVIGLQVGHSYILQEIQAPEGYQLSKDVTFKVDDTKQVQTIRMVDEKEK